MGRIVRPARTLSGTLELDMRVSPKTGQELADEINESASATQSPIMQEHPWLLIVNRRQFSSLLGFTQQMSTGAELMGRNTEVHQTTDRFFKTTLGFVMEVVVRNMSNVEIIADPEEVNMTDEEFKQHLKTTDG